MNDRHSGLIAAVAAGLSLAVSSPAMSQGMGGMMGGGMMGGRATPLEPGPVQGTNPRWDKLSFYVQSNGLACMSCHAYSARGAGPAFADIARRFAGQPGSARELAAAISEGIAGQWPGYPPMPGGLATRSQAQELTELILSLAPDE